MVHALGLTCVQGVHSLRAHGMVRVDTKIKMLLYIGTLPRVYFMPHGLNPDSRFTSLWAGLHKLYSRTVVAVEFWWRANNQDIQKIGVAKAIQTIFLKCSDRWFDGSTARSAS